MAVLEVAGLRVAFSTPRGPLVAVDDVSFAIDRGRALGIVGESGSGKTVTALTVLGLLPPQAQIRAGSVVLDGRDLARLDDRELEDVRGREIGMVFQDPMSSLNPTMSIGTQITEVVRRHLGMGKREARIRALELLSEVGIANAAERLDDYPHRFSGGMRQRVMIAIALSCNPKLLIADEPTTALDVTVQAQVLDLLNNLRERHRMATVLISHDMGVVAEVADDVAVMYAGQIVESAPAVELFERPEHPYTEALLSAIPRLDGEDVRSGRLLVIPGRPPDLVDPPVACRFGPRCPHAALGDSCTVEPPVLRELRPGHHVRSAHAASERAGR